MFSHFYHHPHGWRRTSCLTHINHPPNDGLVWPGTVNECLMLRTDWKTTHRGLQLFTDKPQTQDVPAAHHGNHYLNCACCVNFTGVFRAWTSCTRLQRTPDLTGRYSVCFVFYVALSSAGSSRDVPPQYVASCRHTTRIHMHSLYGKMRLHMVHIMWCEWSDRWQMHSECIQTYSYSSGSHQTVRTCKHALRNFNPGYSIW